MAYYLIGSTPGTTLSVDITRPGDTNAYTAGDALSNSTSAPTSGGFTFTGAARVSGGMTLLADLVITSSAAPGTPLQGEILIFNSSVTNINDNAAFTISDAEVKTLVGKVGFAMETIGANQHCHIPGIGLVCNTVGSADLRFLVRVTNDYTPANAEVITVRAKFVYQN